MDLRLKDKAVLVTGGTRGIGRQIAIAFADEGANVAICGRNSEHLDGAVASLRERGVIVHGIQADLQLPGSASRVVDEAATALGGLQVLVNNASNKLDRYDAFERRTDAQLMARITGKSLPAMQCARAAIPHMRRAGWGRIICMGGGSAHSLLRPWELPGTNSGMEQGVGNAMIVNFARHLSLELAKENILVNVLHPGTTRSDRYPAFVAEIMRERKLSREEADAILANIAPIGRLIEPDDIAPLILFLASDYARAITGQSIGVDGGTGGHITY